MSDETRMTLSDLQQDAYRLWSGLRALDALAEKMRRQLPQPPTGDDLEALSFATEELTARGKRLADGLGNIRLDPADAFRAMGAHVVPLGGES